MNYKQALLSFNQLQSTNTACIYVYPFLSLYYISYQINPC
jgi:hypothetical protein